MSTTVMSGPFLLMKGILTFFLERKSIQINTLARVSRVSLYRAAHTSVTNYMGITYQKYLVFIVHKQRSSLLLSAIPSFEVNNYLGQLILMEASTTNKRKYVHIYETLKLWQQVNNNKSRGLLHVLVSVQQKQY